jgi:hypothetical protein
MAKAKYPEQWSDNIRNWDFISDVHLNPDKVPKPIKSIPNESRELTPSSDRHLDGRQSCLRSYVGARG